MSSDIQGIKRFLDSISYHEEHEAAPDIRKGFLPFVTLSRQTGAGGHSLAQELLRQLKEEENQPLFQGWHLFDRALCEKLVEDPDLKVSMRSLLSEAYHSQLEEIILNLLEETTPQEVVIRKLFQVMRTLATFGKVILVGRAGASVTRKLPTGIHVRLVAGAESRIRRMMKLLNLPEQEAVKIVHRQDQDRARLVRDYFNRSIDDPLLYDAVWNTDTVPLEGIAASIITLIRQKAARQKVAS